MAKARLVVGDQNSAELDVFKRSYNSLLLVLENVAAEVVATTITADEAFAVIAHVLAGGVDDSASGVAAHAPTNRFVVGVKSTPVIPPRAVESKGSLVEMSDKDSF